LVHDVVSTRGYGLHHLALPSYDYDRDLARYRKLGFTIVNEGTAPADHGGGRAAYIDTTSKLPGMIELMEIVPSLSASLFELEAAAANWDGTDPIRVHKFR
jgi:catechol 2,3-dioxygenase-like lactoylglutathione lyase family enzyme